LIFSGWNRIGNKGATKAIGSHNGDWAKKWKKIAQFAYIFSIFELIFFRMEQNREPQWRLGEEMEKKLLNLHTYFQSLS